MDRETLHVRLFKANIEKVLHDYDQGIIARVAMVDLVNAYLLDFRGVSMSDELADQMRAFEA